MSQVDSETRRVREKEKELNQENVWREFFEKKVPYNYMKRNRKSVAPVYQRAEPEIEVYDE